ncbi:MAG TPA: hypothetical protein VD840_09380 [Sinorhizobium sp.]|nr:hypothetical protein [Sinorhizobium sp.]
MRRVRFIFMLATMFLPGAAYGAQCPTAATAEKGFMLLQMDAQSEVRKHHGPIVKIVNTYGTPSRQTVFSYRGLIDLSRMGGDVQQAIYPMSDLEAMFPLKKGARHKISFVPLEPADPVGARSTLELAVTGQETFKLEDCKYKVWRVQQTTKKGDELVDVWSALYSPDLEATLAKTYDEGTAGEYTVRYERIRPLQP